MRPTFDLITEPWIPCVMLDGQTTEFGLRETLARAPCIREVTDASPLVTVSLHRLLLAVLHRNFGPRNSRAWRDLWEAGSWDMATLDAYFGTWRSRFDLFDEHRPFYQTPIQSDRMWGTVAKLAHERGAGNNAALFDHSLDGAPLGVAPAEGARLIVAQQNLALGGLIGMENGKASATHAPLVGSAVALVNGASLFETLMLNLIPYSPTDNRPSIGSQEDDAPAWEQEAPPRPGEVRRPRGYLDYLTWQSRRLFLRPPDGDANCTTLCIVSRGAEFPPDLAARDPFVMYKRREKAKPGENPWAAVRFREDRALWRDSHALLRSVTEQTARPLVVDELSRLVLSGAVSSSARLDVALLGMATDKAKVFLWRHERMPLPLRYLKVDALVDVLRQCLDLTEHAQSALRWAAEQLARYIVSAGSPKTVRREAIAPLVESFPASRLYWAALEVPFTHLLTALADAPDQADTLREQWAETVRREARSALNATTGGLKPDARNLRAITAAEALLGGALKKLMDDFTGGG